MGSSSSEHRDPPALTFPADQQLMDALGTEALIIQNKRTALTSEATNRSSLFVAIVSGALVAAGFVLRTPYAFSFLVIVVPVVLVLGLVTFFRLATIARDDLRLDSQLEWIRAGFRTLSPRAPAYLLQPQRRTGGRPGSPSRIAAVTMSAAGFVGLLESAILGLGVALSLGVISRTPASAASVATGLVVSGLAVMSAIGWLLRGTSADRPGSPGTPASAPPTVRS